MPFVDPERRAEYQRAYRNENRDHLLAEKKEWAKENRERVASRRSAAYREALRSGRCARCGDSLAMPGRTNCEACGASDRSRYLKRRWGISTAERDEMLAAQGGRCAICGVADVGCRSGWHIDHDHVTGRIRAILCGNCNRGLGHFNDNPEMMERAAAYVRGHSAKERAA